RWRALARPSELIEGRQGWLRKRTAHRIEQGYIRVIPPLRASICERNRSDEPLPHSPVRPNQVATVLAIEEAWNSIIKRLPSSSRHHLVGPPIMRNQSVVAGSLD